MLSAANPTLDLLVLELVLHAALLAASLLLLRSLHLPVHARPENNVLAHGGCFKRGSRRVALFQTELGPRSALCDLRVDLLADNGRFDASRHFHFLVVIVESVRHHRLCAVFVRCHLLRWERRGVVELLVVSPVSTAKLSVRMKSRVYRSFSQEYAHFAGRDIVLSLLFCACLLLEFLSKGKSRCGFRPPRTVAALWLVSHVNRRARTVSSNRLSDVRFLLVLCLLFQKVHSSKYIGYIVLVYSTTLDALGE